MEIDVSHINCTVPIKKLENSHVKSGRGKEEL